MTLAERTRLAVDHAPVVDLHTHLFPPEFGELNLWGIDELLTYHYLVAETLRARPSLTPEDFYAMSKPDQADLVWRSLFVQNTPLSEAASGVCTVLAALGLNPAAPDLREARSYFAGCDPVQHVQEVMRMANVSCVTMTNDPLDRVERGYWDAGREPNSRFFSALRVDPIVNHWSTTYSALPPQGYEMDAYLSRFSVREVRRYLADRIHRIRPRYVAVSLEASFTYPETSLRNKMIKQAILPTCKEFDLPFAMMIGVRRSVNPRLGGAGDGMGVADLTSLERLAFEHPDNRFLVTTLARENAQALCVVARKFSNVLPFGCWWFMNNPSLVEENTLLRLEMLGATFVPQHSDARILEQLLYKWPHARRSIAAALTKRYEALEQSGRMVTDEEIHRDANLLMGGNAAGWMGVEL